jgi:hypothetical protein
VGADVLADLGLAAAAESNDEESYGDTTLRFFRASFLLMVPSAFAIKCDLSLAYEMRWRH